MSYNASGHDAFLLLSIPNCTLRTPTSAQTGSLGLECVTLPPSAKATFDRDVFLVLRLNEQEIPLDPGRTVSVSQSPQNEKTYVFHGTANDPVVITLVFNDSFYAEGPLAEDLETFDSVLSQYLTLDYGKGKRPASPPSPPQTNKGSEDLRGRLLLRDEDTGEIVGELDRKVDVREDPSLSQRGHENDPVVIEIPEDASLQGSETAIQAFARNVPPEEHNWMTRSATLVSHGITGGTNLLVRVINSASSYYINNSTPSPHVPAASLHAQDPSSSSFPPEKDRAGGSGPGSASTSGAVTPNQTPPPPSRTVLFLSSERTRKGLTNIHAVSGQAVKVSTKTIKFIDDVIFQAVGGKKAKQARANTNANANANGKPELPPRAGSSSLAPPPYSSTPNLHQNLGADGKPALPPRAPSPSPTASPVNGQAPPLPPRKIKTTARIILSADLILSTIEESTKRIINISADRADAMIRHKHGEEVAQSSKAMAGTARNIGLVYVDLQGIGRKAIVKRVAKTYVKSRFGGRHQKQ
ncbi:hypothetical protein PM082_020363 [Marasmius tenuissimus]|nr:hypothetical protein PM082_020363 [Marasmius tenuissimus]